MRFIKTLILLSLSLIWSVNAQADIYSDFMELFYVYNPAGMEHHKKEGIQTICLYDCITDSLVENRQKLSPLDTIGELKLYFDLKSIVPQNKSNK